MRLELHKTILKRSAVPPKIFFIGWTRPTSPWRRSMSSQPWRFCGALRPQSNKADHIATSILQSGSLLRDSS